MMHWGGNPPSTPVALGAGGCVSHFHPSAPKNRPISCKGSSSLRTEPPQERTIVSNELTPARRARREDPSLVDVIDRVFDRVDPLIKLIESLSEQSLRTREAEGRFKTRMAWFAAIIVGVVVGASAFLTYVGKMDGST